MQIDWLHRTLSIDYVCWLSIRSVTTDHYVYTVSFFHQTGTLFLSGTPAAADAL